MSVFSFWLRGLLVVTRGEFLQVKEKRKEKKRRGEGSLTVVNLTPNVFDVYTIILCYF